jgi:hypothetical protein
MSRQNEVVNTILPRSMLQEIKKMIVSHRQRALWRNKTSGDKHNACWDEVTETPDPDCSVCSGTGYNYTQKTLRCLFQTREPHGFQTGAGSLQTVGGRFNRIDATMWINGVDGRQLRHNDLIIFPISRYEAQVEYTVITKTPYYFSSDVPFLYELKLFKSIRNEEVVQTTEVP